MSSFISDIKKFLFLSSLVSFVILIIGIILFSFFIGNYYTNTIPVALVFFYLINALIFYFQVKAIHQRRDKFTQVFMLTSGIKLFTYLIFALFVFYFTSKAYLSSVAVSVLLFYIIFTLTELLSLMNILKRTPKNDVN
jgi:hypothetical protein